MMLLHHMEGPGDDQPEPDDRNPNSLKVGKFKSMNLKQLHEALGHFGYLRGCIICLQVKKSLNRIYKNPRPRWDPRPGYQWDLDTIYWNFSGVSVRGYLYTMALKDRCTDTMLKVNLATRDESASGFEELVTEICNDHQFKQDYPLFSCINLDLA